MATDIEQLIKDKSEVNKQIMRDIGALIEKLNEAGEGDFVGCANGWKYAFERETQPQVKSKEELT